MNNTLLFNKYNIIKKIANGLSSIVYHAGKKGSGEEICIKILNSDKITSSKEDLVAFQADVEKISKSSCEQIVQIPDIGTLYENNSIVMEFFPSWNLKELIEKKEKIGLNGSIYVIHEVAQALNHAHKQNVYHLDMRPEHVLIGSVNVPLTERPVKVIDFGISKIRDMNKAVNDNDLLRLLRYMAPEVTDDCDDIDQRCDLYSLGVMFYELLTGELPFKAEKHSALIYQLKMKVPEQPVEIDAAIPEKINDIVMKLLEKEPGKRYQSAEGLLYDLKLYQEGRRDFMLGTHDQHVELMFDAEFVGRAGELELIKTIMAQALKGKGRIVFLNGVSGIGKTRLIKEFVDFVKAENRVKIFYEAVQKNNEPYVPFRNLLREYSVAFRKYTLDKKDMLRERFSNEHSGFLEMFESGNITLDSEHDGFFSKKSLDGDNRKHLFLDAITGGILELTRVENGLLFVLDDFHLADAGTMDVVDTISQKNYNVPLLMICVCNSDKMKQSDTLLELAHDSLYRRHVKNIFLEGFDKSTSYSFIMQILREESRDAEKIAELIYNKSQGNPALVIEMLKYMVMESVVYYQHGWQLDATRIDEIEYSGNVLKSVIENICSLNTTEFDFLSLGAVAGDAFTRDLAARFLGDDHNSFYFSDIIEKMTGMGILREINVEDNSYAFIHEKIREYIYENISANTKKTMHESVAVYLEKIRSRQRNNEEKLLFDIARHYIASGNKEKIIEYAFPAGLRSLKKNAIFDAIEYFEQAKKNLTGKGVHAEKLEICNKSLASLYVAAGRYDDAIDLYHALLLAAKHKKDKTYIYRKLSEAHYKKGDFGSCEQTIQIALLLLDEPIVLSRTRVVPVIIKELVSKKIRDYFKIKPLNQVNKKNRMKFDMLYYLSSIYQETDQVKAAYYILKCYNIARNAIGPSTEAIKSLSRFGLLWSCFGQVNTVYLDQALRMSEALNDTKGRAYALQQSVVYNNAEGNYAQSMRDYELATELFRQGNDSKEIALVSFYALHSLYYSGQYRKAEELCNACLDIFEKNRDTYYKNECVLFKMDIFIRRGAFDKVKQLIELMYEKYEKQGEKTGNWQSFYRVNIICAKISILEGTPDRAISYLVKTRQMQKKYSFNPHLRMMYYCTDLEARISFFIKHANTFSAKEAKDYFRDLKKIARKARVLSRFLLYKEQEMLLFIQLGRMYVLFGDDSRAHRNFEDAVSISNSRGIEFEHALAAYEYGRFWASKYRHTKAQQHFVLAYTLFEKIGAAFYVQSIQKQLGIDKEMKKTSGNNFFFELKEQAAQNHLIELNHYISQTADVESILERIVASLVEITGAQKCLLFYKHKTSGKLRLKTEHSVYGDSVHSDYPREILDIVFLREKIYSSDKLFREPLVIPADVEVDPNVSCLCVPAKYMGEMIGVCYFESNSFSLTLSEIIMDVIKAIIANAAMLLSSGEPALTKKKTVIDQVVFKSVCNKYSITDREREIIQSVLDGYTNKEISTLHEITISTVKKHINNIYQKMNITDRDSLIKSFARL